jgi:hypothetical protein
MATEILNISYAVSCWASKIVILGNPKPKNANFVPDVVIYYFNMLYTKIFYFGNIAHCKEIHWMA